MKTKIALAQTESSSNAEQNLIKAGKMIREAKASGASLAVFPENFISAFTVDTGLDEKLKAAEGIDGPSVSAMRKYAKESGIWVIFGMYEPAFESGSSGHYKNYNTTVVIDSLGGVRSVYHKTHLYDAFSYRESDFNVAGDSLFEPIDTPFGKLGLLVCYEIRFPEVARYQALKGADLIVMPTAWVRGEGKSDQLRTLVKCRSIENTVFIAMCDMCGERLGESVVTDPLGNVIAKADGSEQILYAEIDTDRIKEVRAVVPSLANRRPELYI